MSDSITTLAEWGESARALSEGEVFEVLGKLEPWTLPAEISAIDEHGRTTIISASPISDETKAYFDRRRPVGAQLVYRVRGEKSDA